MSEHKNAGWEGAKQRVGDHAGREKKAFKTSGPWFLACGLAFLAALCLAAIGAPVVICGALLVVGLVLMSVGGHKHGKAGGHDQSSMYG